MANRDLLHGSIRRKLAGLRARLRTRLAGEAAAWAMVALVGLVFVTLGFDYYLRLDRPQRGLIMGLCLIGLVWVLWRELIRPMLVPMGEEDLALLVEDRYDELGDRLISAVQFSQPGRDDEATASRAMIDVMARQANETAATLDFERIVERNNMWRAAGAAACAAMLLGGFTFWKQDVMALWFQRNVTIWSNAEWPQENELIVVGGGDFTVVRGRDLKVKIIAAEGTVAPPHVTVHARLPSVAGVTEDRIAMAKGSPGEYVKVFRGVTEEFEFWVTGGDDSRDERRPHKVFVLDPPVLRNVRFWVHYPKYMKQTHPRPVDGSMGTLTVPMGSTIHFTAQSTKDVVWAGIFLDNAEPKTWTIKSPSAKATEEDKPDPRKVWGYFLVDVPAPAARKVRHFQAKELRLALRDTDNITNPIGGQYLLQVLPDQDPKISARKFGVSGSLTPNARVPLRIQASDDNGLFGLTANIEVAQKDKVPPTRTKIPLSPVGRKEFTTSHDIELGGKFKPKTIIQVSVTAADTFPDTWGGPNRSTSGTLDFRIVTPEELMAELVRRQKELRLEFVHTIEQQTAARSKALAAAEAVPGDTIDAEARRLASGSAGHQTSVASECAKAALSLQGIWHELTNNKIGSPDSRKQLLDTVVQPLKDLSEPIGKLVEGLRGLARVSDATTFRDQADAFAQAQLKILTQLKAIRDRMQKLESRQELAYKLETIIKLWNQVMKDTKAVSDKEATDLLGPDKKKPGEDDDEKKKKKKKKDESTE